MDGDRIEMSQRERDRLKVMAPVLEGKRTQKEAARLLQADGAAGAAPAAAAGGRRRRRGGAPAAWAALEPPPGRRACGRRRVEVYRQEMPDFGPTLAAEKLAGAGAGGAGRDACGSGCWPRASGSPGAGGTSTASDGNVGRASASWCRPTAATTTGWKAAGRGWCWWP